MSFSELYGLAKGKHKSTRQGAPTCSAEPHSIPGSDFVELVRENGQVVMQGQSNKTRQLTTNNISVQGLPQNSRLRDKGLVLGRHGMMESDMNDFHIPVTTELDEHDDMVPWLRYHMHEDETVQHKYGPDFYTELSGVTAHNLSNHTNGVQTATGFEQRNGLPIRPKESQFEPLSMRQGICSFPSFRSNASVVDSTQKICSPSVDPRMKMQAQDLGQQLPSSTIMNFSHFAKHTMVKSSLDTSSTKAGPEVSTKEMDGKKTASVSTAAKQADLLHVTSVSAQPIESEYPTQIGNHSGLVSCQDSRNINLPTQKLVSNGNTGTGNNVKTVEPNVASSVCSGNSVDTASNDPTCDLKRKYREFDFEDSEYRSEDIEEDSVGIRKAATNRVGSGSKRSRAAEVHNLSERRRRDRINEKMRALQELIPNCNKVDKASMLDEAIEYLKTLQLQVQMMSMGPGLCMPQMMLPHAAHMPRFSPMSVGMGMGMGYGLGMLDMNGNTSNYQLVQMPSVPGTRFPMAPAPGLCNLTATSLPNIPTYGFQGQSVGTPLTCPPAISNAADPPIRPVMDNPGRSTKN